MNFYGEWIESDVRAKERQEVRLFGIYNHYHIAYIAYNVYYKEWFSHITVIGNGIDQSNYYETLEIAKAEVEKRLQEAGWRYLDERAKRALALI